MKKFFNYLFCLILSYSLIFNLSLSQPVDSITQFKSYEPSGEYRLFGNGRGTVVGRWGGVSKSVNSINFGSVQLDRTRYSGELGYTQLFKNHGWEVHSPFDNDASRKLSKTSGTIWDGFTTTKIDINAHEKHPADGYDGEPDPYGRYPAPKKPRDIYTYDVSGSAISIKIVGLEKINSILPPNRQISERELALALEKNTFNEEVVRDVIRASYSIEGEIYQFKEWEAEKLAESLNLPQSESWEEITSIQKQENPNLLAVASEEMVYLIPIYGDYLSIRDAKGFWETSFAIAGVIPVGKFIKIIKGADKVKDVASLSRATNRVEEETEALRKIQQNQNKVGDLSLKAPNSIYNQQAVNRLKNNNELPGIVTKKNSQAREMPVSLNPNATAEDFVTKYIDRQPVQLEKDAGKLMYGGNCKGCWKIEENGETIVYRTAGNASQRTANNTATVEINSPHIRQINKGKPLKIKFPAKP